MGFFNRVIAIIKQRLEALNLTERLLIAMCVAFVIISSIWLGSFASQKEMVPLLDQKISEDQVRLIVNKLNFWNMDDEYELKGDQIMVPKTQRWKIFYKLSEAEAIPVDISVGFEKLLEDDNVFTSDASRKDKIMVIKQMEMARVIEQWQGVDKATVIINPGTERRLINITPESSAAVAIESNGRLSSPKKTAKAIAHFVAGAVNRLKKEQVSVIIDGANVSIAAGEGQFDSDVFEAQAKLEKHYYTKVYDVVKRISSQAIVQVDLKLDRSRKTEETSKVLDEGQGTYIYDKNKKTVEDNSTQSEQNKEPGLVANASSTGGAGGSSSQTTSEMNDVEKEAIPGHLRTTVETPGGDIPLESRTALVMLPRSYFESVAKASLGLDAVTVQQVNDFATTEIDRIKQMILPALGLTDPVKYANNVTVDYFWGEEVTSALASAGGDGAGVVAGGLGGDQQAASFTVAGILSQYGKHIAVSVFAFFAIIMALMMVRKAVGPPEIVIEEDEAEEMVGRDPLDAFGLEDANLDDEEGKGLLNGMELGEEAVRSQQILEQLRGMVGENPEQVANLLGKWIRSSI